jgi:tetratricopeptide (TPR) repeat protein|nr:tetratricopeptide repeat protein [Segatella cerevisiae]
MKKLRFVFLCLLLLVFGLNVSALTKANADAEYSKGNYQQAIKDYQQLLRDGVSAPLYYNLGNAYYRSDNIPQAVLAYERAHLIQPGDKDIRFNLEFARNKTIDKIIPQSELFFVTWYKDLVNFTSVDHWAYIAIGSLLLSLILVLVYLFGQNLTWRKVGFYGACVTVVAFLLCNLFAFQQKSALVHRTGAIVIAPSISVKKTPAPNSSEAFVIHEGTRVEITDKTMKQWRGVKLADGREGWLRTNQIEGI